MSKGLVQNLRSYPHASRSLRDEAADHIEALEQTMWKMHGEAHEHIKRIEALETALREIAGYECRVGCPYTARRALEGKL